jgi:nucleotide-binding universal stress UspA family protein
MQLRKEVSLYGAREWRVEVTLTSPQSRGNMFKRVVLCHDGSDAARKALKRGAELAMLVHAEVLVLSVISPAFADAVVVAGAVGTVCLVDSESQYQVSLNESVAWLKARGVAAQGCLARGNIIDTIVTHAQRFAADLVVVGHYPKSTGGRWWSGSGRASLAERLNCCVLIAVRE